MNYEDFIKEKDKFNCNCKYLPIKEYIFNENLNFKDFEKVFFNLHEPIVIRGFCKDTIAYKTWNENTLGDAFKNVKFPAEIYENDNTFYNGSDKKDDLKKITINDYIKYIKSGKKPYLYIAEVDFKETDCDLDKLQLDLFNPNILPRIYGKEVSNTLYFGNNASSGCHIHVEDNFILNQMFGEKTIYFFDYHDNDDQWMNEWLLGSIFTDRLISRCGIFSDTSNFINNNFFEMDHSKMKLYKVVLKPGDSVLIPPWWWHSTRGNGINLSITNIYKRDDLRYLFFKPLLICLFVLKYFDLDEVSGSSRIFILFFFFLTIFIIFYRYVFYDF